MNAELVRYTEIFRQTWGPPTTARFERLCETVRDLTRAAARWTWPDDDEASTNGELYRDPEHGFLLVTHTRPPGTYRRPHDHGRGWVVYAVVRGEVEMSTWGWVASATRDARLVRRELRTLGPGDIALFLPGDIHDTRIGSRSVRMLRLTSCDFADEVASGRMKLDDNPDRSSEGDT